MSFGSKVKEKLPYLIIHCQFFKVFYQSDIQTVYEILKLILRLKTILNQQQIRLNCLKNNFRCLAIS